MRRAAAEDLPALADTLAEAFADYPWTRWTVDGDRHAERLRGLYGVYLDVALRFGQVWTTGDCAGVAAWTWSPSDDAQAAYLREEGLDERVAELTGTRGGNAARAEGLLSQYALDEPHWNLQAVGVRPEARGRGLATTLLGSVLRQCDEEGHAAALETSSPDNVRLYLRLGFVTRAEVAIPDGPRVWLMSRHPAGGHGGSGGDLRDRT